jgi:hypothetical protein
MDKQKKKKILFISLGTAATGILGFFGWEWWKNKKDKKQQEEIATNAGHSSGTTSNNNSDSTKTKYSYNAPSSSGSSDFPLHKGSRGAKVKAFQQALIAKYGSSILPKYGADGDFGNEVAAALKKEGLPSTVDESTYNSIVGGGSGNNSSNKGVSDSFDPSGVANSLFTAVQNSDFSTTLSVLRKINDTTQYAAADVVYKTLAPFLGVHKTIVTGVLEAFTDSSQQQQINSEFTRMGLKNNSGKWTLSGLEQHPLVIANEDTEVFEKNDAMHPVPKGTTLGYPFAIKEGWVYFYPVNAPTFLMKVKEDNVTIQKPNN